LNSESQLDGVGKHACTIVAILFPPDHDEDRSPHVSLPSALSMVSQRSKQSVEIPFSEERGHQPGLLIRFSMHAILRP
jgi:hypothetical protein